MIMTRTRAIVLRTVKYGDSSLVVDMLTEAMGRMSFMVRLSASRKGKMRKQLFQPLHIVEIDFDYRSSATTYFDQVKRELEADGLADSMKEQVEALDKAIDMDKETFLNLKKDEIIPFIEEEIAVRYYFQEAGIEVRLRTDEQLKEALENPLIEIQ